jgi:hypothetical protein
LDCGLVLLALVAGWITSSFLDAPGRLSLSGIAERAAAPFGYNYRTILGTNLAVVGVMLLGLCTLGAVSTITLCWNGCVLGFGLSSLFRANGAVVLWLLLYVPPEFTALALAAAASQALSIAVVRYLLYDKRPHLAPVWSLLVAAGVLLALAAAIEVHVVGQLNKALRPAALELSDGYEWIGTETRHEGLSGVPAGTPVMPVPARAFVWAGRPEWSRKDDVAQSHESSVEGKPRGAVVRPSPAAMG